MSKPYDLTVVMPVYNEAEAIGPVLAKWKAMLGSLGIRYRISAYNDGSKDKTGEILDAATRSSGGTINGVTKPNSGHGPTILQGYRNAAQDSDWVFQIDSDDEMGPESFPKLWAEREKYDFLVGRRDGRKQPLPRKIVSFVSRLCVRLFYGKGIWDVNTPYRLMRAEKFAPFYEAIPSDTFAPNVILSGLAARHKLRMLEIPVPQHDRTTGEVSIKKWKLLKAAARSFGQTIRFGFAESKSKKGVWLAILVGCVAINLVTLTRSPTVWMDEVSYADPGIRLATGQGFTTSVWYSQNEETFFAGNVPLHPFLLSGWVSVWGDSCFAVRSFNIFLMVIATTLLYFLLRRLTRSYVAAWLGVLLMWCSMGILFSYRSARPDIEVFVFGIVLLLGLFEHRKGARYALLGVASFLMPFAGIQGLPWLPLLLIFAYALSRFMGTSDERLRDWILKGVFVGLCALVGLVALFGLYSCFGVLDIFLSATFGVHSLASSSNGLLERILTTLSETPQIFMYPCLVLALGVILLFRKQGWRWYVATLASCLVIPYALAFFGKYPMYYYYMGDFPLVLLLCVAFARNRNCCAKSAVLFLSAVLCLGGLGARTVIALLEWSSRDPEPVDAFIAQHIPANSVVDVTWQAYYAVRAITPNYYMSKSEAVEQGKRPPSIYAETTAFLIVEQKDAPSVDTEKWQFVAAYEAPDGIRKGGAMKYAFSIFSRK